MLRDYQLTAIANVQQAFMQKIKKVLLHSATGSGKTAIFCEVIKQVHKKGTKALVVVAGRMLVDQASKRLEREDVPHGVIMAGHWRNRPSESIQVCSIDTLNRRQITELSPGFIVIDEAHQATSQRYHRLIGKFPEAYYMCVTATPYCKDSLEHVAQKIIKVISMKELIEQGYLVPPRYYAPSIPDLCGVKTKNDDYDIQQLDDILNKSNPIGDVVSSWKKLAENRSTLLFAVSVNHSERIAATFRWAGISAEHVDAETPEDERAALIKKLVSGEVKILSNVGIFCTGVDIPEVSCVVMVRPTKSYTLFIQQAGRGTRPATNKKDFILIDHAGNLFRHGCIMDEREGWLCAVPKNKMKDFEKIPNLANCPKCFAVYNLNCATCPSCGEENLKKAKKLEPIQAEITEPDKEHLRIIGRRNELKGIAKRRGYKNGWVYHMMCAEFGEDVAQKYCPKRIVPHWISSRNTNKAW